MRSRLGIGLLLALALACGQPGKKAEKAPATRAFPMAEIPVMITEPMERLTWLSQHFWDRFTATDSLYFCDSVTVNGVPALQLEQQLGMFATLVEEIPLPDGVKAMELFFDRLEAFQRAKPSGNVLPETVALASRYFYDPNSPVRNEDLYGEFVSRLGKSDLIDSGYRMGYEWDARMCRLNRVGTRAADFAFTDTRGWIRTLYSIKAEYTVLIFGNPGCTACQEIMEAMAATPEIAALIDAGRLQVVDVYIDREIDDWKAHMAEYPKNWINGYDHNYTIRTDLIYNVRGIPSLYLLDAKKTVLMKDATPERVLTALASL